jgi:2-iminobutanoate/2-iminopropanoate deaminase
MERLPKTPVVVPTQTSQLDANEASGRSRSSCRARRRRSSAKAGRIGKSKMRDDPSKRVSRDCDRIRMLGIRLSSGCRALQTKSTHIDLGEKQMKSRLLTGLLLLAATAAAQTDRKFLTSQLAGEKHLPFSSAVLAGQTLYIAGTIADTGKLAAGLSAEEEAKNVMEQLKKTIESAGMTMDDVVSIQVYCTDLALYDAFNGVYSKYFHAHFPARAFVGVAKLLFGAHFEVGGIAVAKR